MRLTEQVHHDLKQYIHAGDCVIDATAGNGYDTLFLAQIIGDNGLVFSFDVQRQALEKTRQRVEEYDSIGSVKYIHCGHEWMQAEIPTFYHGRVQAIVFNLGYLPQAEHVIITKPSTTLAALQQSIALLRQGGVISIVAYTGHEGGRDEAESIKQWLTTLGDSFEYHLEIPKDTRRSPPEYIFIQKNKGALAPIGFLGH